MYDLPEEWESFYTEMCKRAKDYIRISYWDITEEDLDLWLFNFKEDEEKFLSAIIIYRLIYRNEQPRLSMYHHIIEVLLPSILEEQGIYVVSSLDQFHYDLQHSFNNIPFKFATIENVDTKASKSGHEILRNFARKGSFHSSLEISINNIEDLDTEKTKAIILLDDIMGTGEQFDTYLQTFQSKLEKFTLIYCPLTAHIDAISYIRDKYPDVIVSPVEILEQNYTFFDSSFMPKIAENINMDEFKEFYCSFIKSKTKLKKILLGKEDQALTYIFDVSSPNNSLPILTYADENWNKLFPR